MGVFTKLVCRLHKLLQCCSDLEALCKKHRKCAYLPCVVIMLLCGFKIISWYAQISFRLLAWKYGSTEDYHIEFQCTAVTLLCCSLLFMGHNLFSNGTHLDICPPVPTSKLPLQCWQRVSTVVPVGCCEHQIVAPSKTDSRTVIGSALQGGGSL